MKLRILVLTFCFSCFCSFSSFAEPASEAVPIVHEDTSFASVIDNLYLTTEHPEFDEIIKTGFKEFEKNKEKSSPVYFYRGSMEECADISNYFNYQYGYTKDFRTKLYQYQHGNFSEYRVGFPDTLNADQRMNDYKEEVARAVAIAATLKADDRDQTIKNIRNWIHNNVHYYYGTEHIHPDHDFGQYHGNEVVCTGFAKALYQLCSINGIPATIRYLNPGNLHAVNTVTYSDGIEYWVDAQSLSSKSLNLWEGNVEVKPHELFH